MTDTEPVCPCCGAAILNDGSMGFDEARATAPAGLDEDRLARAIEAAEARRWREGSKGLIGNASRWAKAIAVEYDRLAASGETEHRRDDNRYVWLIERGQPEGLDRPQWWGVSDSRTGAHGWLDTVWPADQFETKAEAEAVIARLNSRPGHPFNARAVEHGFIAASGETEQDGIIQRSHVPCCWCGEHHEEGR